MFKDSIRHIVVYVNSLFLLPHLLIIAVISGTVFCMDNSSISREIRMLRSLAVSLVGRDSEGMYRPEFVRRILQSVSRTPTKRYTDKKSFLAELLKND